jgi:hypothetical protein
MSKNNNISTPQVADPNDVRAGLVSAVASIILLMILLFIITYQIADPPPQDAVVTADAVIDEILLKDLKLESGSIGGGSPSNDRVDKPKEQIQEIITGKSKRSSAKSGKSNKTNGNDANNEASTTVKDHFGGGGGGGGGYELSREDNSDPGDEEPKKRKSIIRKNEVSLPQFHIDYLSYIHLKLTVNANGEVLAAECIKSKTNCSDQSIINQVIKEVIRQVKYNKENGADLIHTFYTVEILAK